MSELVKQYLSLKNILIYGGGGLLTVVTLWLGWEQFKKAVATLDRIVSLETTLREITSKLGNITESLSTRFIGMFPGHIDQITVLVAHAERSVIILADCIDYGSFRDFAAHERLLTVLCDLARSGKRVEYLVWGDVQPMSRANKYRDMKKRMGPNFRTHVQVLLKNLQDRKGELSPEFELVSNQASDAQTDWSNPKGAIRGLVALQMKFHILQMNRLAQSGVKVTGYTARIGSGSLDAGITGTSDEEPSQELFFWLVDGREGIFIAPNYGEDALAFSTKDAGLVATFGNMFQRRRDYAEAHPVESG